MRPVVFTLFGNPVHAYFFFLSVGLFLAMTMAAWRTELEEIDTEAFLNMEVAIFGAALIGCRLFFIGEAWDFYAKHPAEMLRFWNGGVSFYGGLVFGAAAGLTAIYRQGLPLGRVTDFCAAYIVLGHIFGKAGCFFHGCCYGKPTGGAWGYVFARTAKDELPRHPAQLYELFGLAAIFALLASLRSLQRAPGTVIATYMVAYGVLRFFLEYIRDDMVGPAYLGLYRYQWTSALMAAGGLALLARLRR